MADFKAPFLILGRIKSEWSPMQTLEICKNELEQESALQMLGSSSPPCSLPTLDCFDSNR